MQNIELNCNIASASQYNDYLGTRSKASCFSNALLFLYFGTLLTLQLKMYKVTYRLVDKDIARVNDHPYQS